MKFSLLYFEGCLSYQQALENLRETIAEDGLEAKIELVNVTSPAEAERLNFLGSPTIQIDGVDLEGPEAVKTGVGFGCRVYEDKGQMRGWPTKEQIRAALKGRFKESAQPNPAGCCGH